MYVSVKLQPDGIIKKTKCGERSLRNEMRNEIYYNYFETLEFPGDDYKEDLKGRTLIFRVCRADDTVYAEVESPKLETVWCFYEWIELPTVPSEDHKNTVQNLLKQMINLNASLDVVEKKLRDQRKYIKVRHQRDEMDLEKKHKEEISKVMEAQKEELNKRKVEQIEEIEEIEKHLCEYKKKKTGFRIPECPVCFEELKTPIKIFNCTNGHLICEKCKESVRVCTLCRAAYGGRATEMEKFIHSLLEEK